jgi:hypothetical protein
MPALFLNGRLCNGNGKSKDEYKVADLKQIAKDNGIFVLSGSNKEEICKEIIKHNKEHKMPLVIDPVIAQTKKPVAVMPVVVPREQAYTAVVPKAVVPVPAKVALPPAQVSSVRRTLPTPPTSKKANVVPMPKKADVVPAPKKANVVPASAKTRAAPKPRESKGDCVKQDLKKYADRPSPPYPANECRGEVMKGNDGRMYVSKAGTGSGIYRWVLNK